MTAQDFMERFQVSRQELARLRALSQWLPTTTGTMTKKQKRNK